jgi:hypothetical protein
MLLAAIPLLAGCVGIDGAIDLRDDGTTSYDFTVTTSQAYLAEIGVEPTPALCDDVARAFPVGVRVTADVTAEHVACHASGTAPTLQFSDHLERSTGAIISHVDGTYTFEWATGVPSDAHQRIDGFEFSVTFPGGVLEHNGSSTVWLNTVTWRDPDDLMSDTGLRATGRDRGWPLPVLAAGALVVGIGLLLALAVRAAGRRRAAPEEDVPDGSGSAPQFEGTVAGAPAAPRGERLPPQAWAPDAGPAADPPRATDPSPPIPTGDTPEPGGRSPWAPPG